jgi:hypothetical protein
MDLLIETRSNFGRFRMPYCALDALSQARATRNTSRRSLPVSISRWAPIGRSVSATIRNRSEKRVEGGLGGRGASSPPAIHLQRAAQPLRIRSQRSTIELGRPIGISTLDPTMYKAAQFAGTEQRRGSVLRSVTAHATRTTSRTKDMTS